MKKINWTQILAVVLLTVFIAGLVPMLAIAKYNYPSADDFMYGAQTRAVWQQTGSFLQTVIAAAKETANTYLNWQGSYTAIFLMALQPDIFGAYWLTTFILLGIYILGTCMLGNALFCKLLKADKWESMTLTLLILLFSIQLIPQTVEAFYWYNGAIYYTFMYGLGLIYVSLHVSAWAKGNVSAGKLAAMILLAALIGGGNFCLLLPLLSGTILITAYAFYKKNKTAVPFAVAWAVLFIGFLLNISAPGNQVRKSQIVIGRSAVKSIVLSLGFELQDFIRWLNLTVVLAFILALPILIKIIRRMNFSFRWPAAVTFVSYCIYAMQYTAQHYATSSIWTGRLYAQLYYSFYWTVGLNVFYWLGWVMFHTKQSMGQSAYDKMTTAVSRYFKGYAFPALAACGMAIICSFYVLNRKTSPAYSALQDLQNGSARQYAAQHQERLALYENESLQNIEVSPLSVKPYVLFFNDFTNSEDDWRRDVLCSYYKKQSIVLKEE
ncbi:MAG: DUF6056 family protein [Oscillospiraceae bacterium]|nr:DUF6056 family protein [Oscillospiraceae bacterium]